MWRVHPVVGRLVCAAGTRFRYPSSFVLVGGEVDADLTRFHASLFQQQSADADTSVSARMTNPVDSALSKLAGSVRVDCSFGDKRAARSAINKVWQDGVVSSGLSMHGYLAGVVFHLVFLKASIQGDHLSGKPGNVREFETCQGNVRDIVNSQGNVREKILSGKSVPKLFISR